MDESEIGHGVWGNLLVVSKLGCSPSMIDCGALHILIAGVDQGRDGWMLVVEQLLKGSCMPIASLRDGDWMRSVVR